MNKKLIAAVDADDVIFHFSKTFEECISQVCGRNVQILKYEWDLSERYGVSASDIESAWDVFHEKSYWEKLDLKNNADNAIDNLIKKGFEVHIVTALDPKYHNDRIKNLESFGIHNVELHCVGNSGKYNTLKKIKPIIFFDDNPEHHHDALLADVPYRILIDNNVNLKREAAHTHKFISLDMAVENLEDYVYLNPDNLNQKNNNLSFHT